MTEIVVDCNQCGAVVTLTTDCPEIIFNSECLCDDCFDAQFEVE